MTDKTMSAAITREIEKAADRLVALGMADRAAAYRAMIYIALANIEDEHELIDPLYNDMQAFSCTVADTIRRIEQPAQPSEQLT